ncbi:MAG TPA: hypothetical protein VHU91_08735 [Mycobacteriales bacterium]|jgi:hypothetical protein|nr:hypothetical protein [Mycobacteriales bacterium]
MKLEGRAWTDFFDSFQREAFRLETLPVYQVESERGELATFLATGKLDMSGDEWVSRIRQFRSTGRWIGRVHVLRRPLTDYLRYEFAAYRHNAAAGEDIRILDLTDRADPGLPSQDYWMFDESAVVRMDYAEDGTQIGRELLEGVDPAPYVAWRRLALENAVPFTEYDEN